MTEAIENETLMTDDANPNNAEPTSAPADNATATGAVDDSQTPQTDAAAPATQPQEDAQDKAEEKAVDAPQGAPETYTFQAPEGTTLDEAVLESFSAVAKELDLPQDKAQMVLDKMAPVLATRQVEQLQAARETWAETSRADKEFGGEKLDENLAVAKKAMDAFATPELRTLLNESGLGNHPEVIRMFYRTGRAMSEDRFVTGQAAPARQKDARNLYAASNMNP